MLQKCKWADGRVEKLSGCRACFAHRAMGSSFRAFGPLDSEVGAERKELRLIKHIKTYTHLKMKNLMTFTNVFTIFHLFIALVNHLHILQLQRTGGRV